jgi:hypothetical protein
MAVFVLFYIPFRLYHRGFSYRYEHRDDLHDRRFGYNHHDQLKSEHHLNEMAGRAAGVEFQSVSHADAEAPAPTSGSLQRSDLGTQDPSSVGGPAPVVEQPKPPPRTDKIELTIDSLQNYELLKPIRVIVESLGDKVFVAEAPELNVSTSGTSVGGALILLKDHISTIYEGYTSKKNLDSERARHFKTFETYIGRPRRNWM